MDREYDFGEPDMSRVQQHILPGLRLREQEELRLPYPESWFESMSGSQEDLARGAEIERAYVSDIEQGRQQFRVTYLPRLAKALK
jgi:transcriptional regulator with XRE-family HTH domain